MDDTMVATAEQTFADTFADEIDAHPAAVPKLSIVISTFNRGSFIGRTLDSIVGQLTDACEILILDNASTDETQQVVTAYARREPRVRYIRREINQGIDRNFDAAVEAAAGEYCWLLPDDDYIKPGGISAVLATLVSEPSVVFVNFEFKDVSMTRVTQERCLWYDTDRVYGPWELDRLFFELNDLLRYIGAIVIKRSIWLERDRNLYVGSLFSFVGIIFQRRLPGHAHVIAQPYVSYRHGNSHNWSTNGMELMFAKWPSLVASLAISNEAKKKVHSAEPWKHPYELLIRRGAGQYTMREYRRWIRPQLGTIRERFLPYLTAALPGVLVNIMMLAWLRTRTGHKRHQLQSLYREMLWDSRFYYKNWGGRERPREWADSE